MIIRVVNITFNISASKTTLSLNNFKILRPKVMKNLTNLLKKFCEFPPRIVKIPSYPQSWTIKYWTNKILIESLNYVKFLIRKYYIPKFRMSLNDSI